MDHINVAEGDNQVPIELPLELDKTLLLSTLVSQFPNACGLKFQTETNKFRGVRFVDGKFYLPEGFPSDTIFYCVNQEKEKEAKAEKLLKLSQLKNVSIPMSAQHPTAYVQDLEPLTASRLTLVDISKQKQMLGECLFPLIMRIHSELAGKITGMLLESSDYFELLDMLKCQERLETKVEEAVAVLQAHQKMLKLQRSFKSFPVGD